MTRFVALLFPVLFLFGTLSAQDGPCLKIIQNGETNTVDCPPTGKHADAQSPQLLVEFRHPDKKASVSGNGWLKTFWIFGDGNFAAFPDTDQAREEATLDMDYTYSKGGEYVVTPVMVEKKSNRTPPGSPYRMINVKGDPPVSTSESGREVNSFSADEFTHEVMYPSRANLLLSSQVRLGGYDVALAASSTMPAEGTQSLVLFYYNSVKASDAAPFTAGQLFKSDGVRVANPNYLTSEPSLLSSAELPLFLDPVMTSTVFNDVIVQPVSVDYGVKPANFDEFRFFPILTTPEKANESFNTGIPAIDATGMGKVQFVSLVLQNAVIGQGANLTTISAGQSTPAPLTASEVNRIVTQIGQHLPWLLSKINTATLEIRDAAGVGTGVFIGGIDHTTTAIVSVIDPTALYTNHICPDEKEPGIFLADLTMSVCNEGNMTESKVEVDIIKRQDLLITDLAYSPDQISNLLTSTDKQSIWRFDYGKNGGLAGAYETGQFESSCFDVHFTLKTDWKGVLALQQGEGLTAKVHFTTAMINAEQSYPNIPFKEFVVTPEGGYRCVSPSPAVNKAVRTSLWKKLLRTKKRKSDQPAVAGI